MRVVASLAAGLLAALLLSQAGESAPRRKFRAPADGGPVLLGTDPPGTLKPSPDAGVQAAVDAGPTAADRQIAETTRRIRVEIAAGSPRSSAATVDPVAA